ncbi:DUF2345 domain-containing protein, partial [Paraburkholderia phymatum]
TAYDQPGAGGKQLAMAEVVAQLRELLTLAESLAQSADASKASPADTSAQKAINDALNELNKPGVLVSAPGPVGVVSGDGIELGSDGSIIATAGKGMHFSVLRRFTVAARDVVSLFTQKGMNLIAAAGSVVVQAQRGRMQLAAQEDLTVESVDGVLHVKSPKEIVLNVGGSYLRMTPDGIELGTRGAIRLRSAGLSKTGPTQLDLGGAAFAPKFVPFKADCEVWRTNANFVQETAPTPKGMENTGAVPPAPSPDGSYAESLPPPQIPFPPGSGTADKGKVTIHDPENASGESRDNPEPIALKTAVPCNWQLDKFTSLASMVRETPRYHRYQDTRIGPEKVANDRFIDTGGTAPTKCRFSYDPGSRMLTAKVVIAFIPRLLVRMNPATKEPLRDDRNNYVVVKYESMKNGANSQKTYAEQQLMLVDRDVAEVNASAYKSEIETTLNQSNYKLILDGCQKGAACGCRISVKFCVDIHVVTASNAAKIDTDLTVNLFPDTERADAANWPEAYYDKDNRGNPITVKQQVKAHECGHLFNFPDEYWRWGGFVHKQYVKDDLTLDFALGDTNATGNKTWQIYSAPNLMGSGALQATATVQPYYLEYIRRWFSTYTNKAWRIGYESKAVSGPASGGATPSGSNSSNGPKPGGSNSNVKNNSTHALGKSR